LTLCLLAALAALCWPAFDRMMDGHRLRKAADQVRARWAQARVRAVDGDCTYVFQCVSGGNEYGIEGMATGDPSASESGGQSTQSTQWTLPDGVTFAGCEVSTDARAALVASQNDDPAAESGNSQPILFYCDGTATSAKVILANERGRAVEVALRGLTGVATVGDVFALQERSP
jgi:Tfp pilus assembly protein FimT